MQNKSSWKSASYKSFKIRYAVEVRLVIGTRVCDKSVQYVENAQNIEITVVVGDPIILTYWGRKNK